MKDVVEVPKLCSKLMIRVSEGSDGQQTMALICVCIHSFISTCYLAQASQRGLITAKQLLALALIPRLSYYPEIFVLIIVILGSQCHKME